jgi:hypothetical protein
MKVYRREEKLQVFKISAPNGGEHDVLGYNAEQFGQLHDVQEERVSSIFRVEE